MNASARMLTRESVENIIAELSAHLEGGYQDGLSRGLDESEASIFTFALAHDGISRFRFFAFSLALVNWAVLPASALLIGALPFLKSGP